MYIAEVSPAQARGKRVLAQPIDDCCWHSAGTACQLADREAGSFLIHASPDPSFMEWPSRMAPDVRGDSNSIGTLLHLDVPVAREPALARKECSA